MINVTDIIVPIVLAIAFIVFIVGVSTIIITLTHDLSKPTHKSRRDKNYYD